MAEVPKAIKDIQYLRRHWGDIPHDAQIRVRSKQEQDIGIKLHEITNKYESTDGELLTPENDIRIEGGAE